MIRTLSLTAASWTAKLQLNRKTKRADGFIQTPNRTGF